MKMLAHIAEYSVVKGKVFQFWTEGSEILPQTLDAIDAKILDLIQKDAALSVAEIADRVGLSSSPCWRRIKRMEEAGIIEGRVTLLDRDTLGLGFEVVASVKLALPSKENLNKFEQLVRKWPEVLECMTVTGAVDYVIRITTTDMHAYDSFLREKLLGSGLVSDVQSRIVINVAKRTTALPLGLISDYVPAG
nr:Lrp/AsnC family transcriptional regulator [Henriciella sp.]